MSHAQKHSFQQKLAVKKSRLDESLRQPNRERKDTLRWLILQVMAHMHAGSVPNDSLRWHILWVSP